VARPSDSSDAFAARIELGRLYSSGSDTDNALRWYEAAVALATEHEDSEDLREARAYIARTNSDNRRSQFKWTVSAFTRHDQKVGCIKEIRIIDAERRECRVIFFCHCFM
jgi:hypothetical protein